MRINKTINGIELIREKGDKALSHESNVTHHIRRLLNEENNGKWVRCYPHKIGLTACEQGVRNKKTNVFYWHDRYALELAHKAFNSGIVFYSINE